MARRMKTPAETVAVPATLSEANVFVARIGAAQQELDAIQAGLDAAAARVKAEHEALARPLRADIAALTRGVQVWAEAHRGELTQDGRVKTVKLPSGEIAWRTRPPSVRLSGIAAVIEAIRERGLHGFLRVRAEVNKEAMLAEPELAVSVPGVTIGSAGEEFIVTPAGMELAP